MPNIFAPVLPTVVDLGLVQSLGHRCHDDFCPLSVIRDVVAASSNHFEHGVSDEGYVRVRLDEGVGVRWIDGVVRVQGGEGIWNGGEGI